MARLETRLKYFPASTQVKSGSAWLKETFRPNSITSTCCRCVVQLVVQHIYNKTA